MINLDIYLGRNKQKHFYPDKPELLGLARKVKLSKYNNEIKICGYELEIVNFFHQMFSEFEIRNGNMDTSNKYFYFHDYKCFKLTETILFISSEFMSTTCEHLKLSNNDLAILSKDFVGYYTGNSNIKNVYC